MIRFEHVSFSYEPDAPVLTDVSFHIPAGEAVGLIGANGAGKSTLLRLMTGLLLPREGRILIGGVPVEKEHLKEIRKTLGLVLQDSDDQLFMPTVYEDLIFGPRNYMLSKEEADERARTVLEELGIPHLLHRYNHKLSGGEKRMAAVASVLTTDPRAVVMDEPTTGLDPVNRRAVIRTVSALPQTRLIASHDLDMILDCCSRVILLSEGTVAADGPAQEILTDRALLESHHLELPLRFQS